MLTKPVDGSKSKDGKADEIPIPEIRKVASYEQDYRANFVKPSVYLRSPAFGAPMSEIVEYDLDNDDGHRVEWKYVCGHLSFCCNSC